VLTLCGWRVISAALAWTVVLAEAYVPTLRYHTNPVGFLHAWWLTVLGWRRATLAAGLSRAARFAGRGADLRDCR
jgi:hypothetical protein